MLDLGWNIKATRWAELIGDKVFDFITIPAYIVLNYNSVGLVEELRCCAVS